MIMLENQENTVLVFGNLLQEKEKQILEEKFKVHYLSKEKDPEAFLQENKERINALVTAYNIKVSSNLINALPNLEVIAQFGAGTDNLPLDIIKSKNIPVSNTPDLLTDDTADIALSLVLSLFRRTVEADMFVRVGKWHNGSFPLSHSPKGKTACIVGLGRIGQAIAKRCEAIGMNIIYHGPREKADQPYRYFPDLKEAAATADLLVLACPGGEDTTHLIDAPILDALGPSGYLVNIARGSVVDQEALLIALRNKSIAGAGLDVYQNEPNVPEALFSMDNVVLLPHIGSGTKETRSEMGSLVIQNLKAFFTNQPLITDVK